MGVPWGSGKLCCQQVSRLRVPERLVLGHKRRALCHICPGSHSWAAELEAECAGSPPWEQGLSRAGEEQRSQWGEAEIPREGSRDPQEQRSPGAEIPVRRSRDPSGEQQRSPVLPQAQPCQPQCHQPSWHFAVPYSTASCVPATGGDPEGSPALVPTNLTVLALVPCWAPAHVGVDLILARGSVLARVGVALIPILERRQES